MFLLCSDQVFAPHYMSLQDRLSQMREHINYAYPFRFTFASLLYFPSLTRARPNRGFHRHGNRMSCDTLLRCWPKCCWNIKPAHTTRRWRTACALPTKLYNSKSAMHSFRPLLHAYIRKLWPRECVLAWHTAGGHFEYNLDPTSPNLFLGQFICRFWTFCLFYCLHFYRIVRKETITIREQRKHTTT